MAVYNGSRRGGAPNYAHFLQDLNEISPREQSPKDDGMTDAELDLYTNTQFIDDFSTTSNEEQRATAVSRDGAAAPPASAVGDFDFAMAGDEFNSFDFGTFATPSVPGFTDSLGSLQGLQSNQAPGYSSAAAQQSSYAVPSQAGDKRVSDAGHSRQLSFEEHSRIAAEEDKRRRNTAASARFRVKKKAREQALEKREKELSDEVGQLKNRITHLETENKWLRGLVMEKTGAKESKFDPKLAAALKVLGKDSDSEEDERRERTKAEEAEKKIGKVK